MSLIAVSVAGLVAILATVAVTGSATVCLIVAAPFVAVYAWTCGKGRP